MGSGDSHQTTTRNSSREVRPTQQVPPNYYNSYPGIYPRATNEYPIYSSKYPWDYYGGYYQNEYYPPPPTGHISNEFSPPNNSHDRDDQHRRRVRNQQQQTQPNSHEYATQTTPTLFLRDNNPDDIPRSTPPFLRKHSDTESLDENSIDDDEDILPLNSPQQPSPISPPKKSSANVFIKKVLSPNASTQRPSVPVNPPSATSVVPQKVARPVIKKYIP